jgi:hypothetical protein
VEQDEGITLPEVPVRHRYAGSPVIHYALLWLAGQHAAGFTGRFVSKSASTSH